MSPEAHPATSSGTELAVALTGRVGTSSDSEVLASGTHNVGDKVAGCFVPDALGSEALAVTTSRGLLSLYRLPASPRFLV